MSTTTPNEFDFSEEFTNANVNYAILLHEMADRLRNLQTDIAAIKDPEVQGFAVKVYTELKLKYFDLLRADLDMQHDLRMEYICENVKPITGDVNDDTNE